MAEGLLDVRSIGDAAAEHLARVGRVFAEFRLQDSGNLCFGVDCGGERFF